MLDTTLARGARHSLCALAFMLVWASALPARAGEPGENLYKLVTKGWLRGCPSHGQLRKEIVRQLGWDPFSESAGKTVSVGLEVDDHGLGGVVELLGASGEMLGRRQIASSRRKCSDLSKTLALVVALALDERSHVESSRAETAQGRVASSVTPGLVAEVPHPHPPIRRAGPRWILAAGGEGALGSGPGPAAGAVLALETRWPRWSVGFEGALTAATGTTVPGGQVSAWLLSATLAGCARPRLLGLEMFGACGLLAVGYERAQGSGYPGEHSADGLYAAAGARVLAEVFRLDRLSLVANVDVLAPMLRARFTVSSEALWQAPVASAAAGLRVGYAF